MKPDSSVTSELTIVSEVTSKESVRMMVFMEMIIVDRRQFILLSPTRISNKFNLSGNPRIGVKEEIRCISIFLHCV